MDFSDILAAFQDPEPEGNGFVAHCTAHEDSHKSLRIALSEGGNAILKCRAGCLTEDVVAEAGLRMRDLFSVSADGAIPVAKVSDEPVSTGDRARMMAYLESCSQRLHLVEGTEARAYALARFGVTEEMASAFGLGFDPGGGVEGFNLLGAAHQRAPRLVVPFRDEEGIPTGFQSRALVEDSVRWAGPTNPPEGGSWSKLAFFESGSGTDFVVVTEGPGDALTAAAAGVDSVGIRGAALGSGVAERLSVALEGRRVVIAADADRAGSMMKEALGARLAELGIQVHFVELPSGVEDLTAWHEADPSGFPEAFQAAIFGAPSWVPPVDPPTEGWEPEEEEPEFWAPTTQVEAARLVVDRFEGRLVWILGLGFHIYRGGVWEPSRLGEVRLEAHSLADEYEELIPELEREDHEARARAFVRFMRSTVNLDRIEKEVKGLVLRETSEFDQHPYLLAVANGVVDLRSGDLLPHDPALLLTQKVDLDYRPGAPCPRWEAFLQEVFPDSPGLPEYIRRFIGYGISGDTSEQCFGVLWGMGANGKSVFTETLHEVFSGISKVTPFSTFEDRSSGGIPNDIAALRGARLVFASEGERGKPMAESVLKRVTGQDVISARFMRQEFFEFRPSFLLLMASNHKPNFRSADEGLWRRVKMIPWRRFFAPEERDHHLRQKLVAEEAEGILAWAVRGAVEYHEEGLKDPPAVQSATASYRDSSDPLASFFPHGPLQKEEGSEVSAKEVWEAYLEWCDEEALASKDRWGRSTFFSGLEERGLVKHRRASGYVFLGAKVVS